VLLHEVKAGRAVGAVQIVLPQVLRVVKLAQVPAVQKNW